MEPLHRVTPDELASLQMENELLRFELQHLRARLTESETALKKAGAGEVDLADARAVPENEAQQDLVWLLQRIDEVPIAGRLLRRRPGVRRLRERHLGERGA